MHDEADDWAPLATDQHVNHPGEVVEIQKKVAPIAPPPEPPPEPPPLPSPPANPRVDDPEAQKALRELRQRIAAAGRSQSLVAAVQQRDDRARRQQRAARVLENHSVVESELRPADVPLAVDFAEGAEGRDPREEEAWFRDLPPPARQRLTAVWEAERARETRRRRGGGKGFRRACIHGAILAALVGTVMSLMTPALVRPLVLTVLGGLGAGCAQAFGAGRFHYAILGTGAFLACYATEMWNNPFALYGALLMGFGFGTLGMEAEMRRTGGFENEA
ncbi:MAG: hypothetical protein U1E73_08370 [Planctomycetota bacterium]